jgi:hypothetical protein
LLYRIIKSSRERTSVLAFYRPKAVLKGFGISLLQTKGTLKKWLTTSAASVIIELSREVRIMVSFILDYTKVDPSTAVNKLHFTEGFDFWCDWRDIDEDSFIIYVYPVFEEDVITDDDMTLLKEIFSPWELEG